MQNNPVARKYTLFLVVGIVLAVLLLLLTRPEPELEQLELPPLQVAVSQAERSDVQPVIRVGGLLRPLQQAHLQFQVTGRLQRRWVEPGQQVESETALLQLDGADYQDLMIEAQARLQQEQGAIERDKRLLQLAERNRALQLDEVKRQERLGSDSLSSKAALDAARQRLIQLQAEEQQLRYSVDTAQARLDLSAATARRAERNWQRTTLKAPFAGTVNRIVPQLGDDVAASEVVLELLDLSELEFYTELDRAVATQLELGQEITVLLEGQRYSAQIVALQKHPDPDTYTYALRARFENPGLLSGAAAEAELQLASLQQVLVVPLTAVVHDDGQTYIFAVKDGLTQRRQVTLGPRQAGQQVIFSGLDAGELVVSRDGAGLGDGLRVQY